MRRWAALIGAAVVLSVTPLARAATTPLMLSGFDVADGNASMDSYEFLETESGGTIADADVAICTQSASCQVHNSLNGGSATSKKALRVDAAANEVGYYSLDPSQVTLNSAQVATNIAIWTAAAPGTATRILEHREGASGANLGCYVQLNTDLTLSVKDNDGHTFGTTAKKLQAQFCSGGTCTTDQQCASAGLGDVCVSGTCKNIRTPCPSGDSSGCPSIPAGMGGGSQTCATCTTSTGAGCYWGTLGLITTTTGNGRLCELKWDGALLVTGAAQSATPSNVTDIRLGVTGGLTSGTLTASFDDFVLTTGSNDMPMSRVSFLCPNVNGSPQDFSKNTCGGGASTHVDCIADYCTSTYELGNGFLSAGGKNKQDVYYGLSNVTDVATTATVVDAVWVADQASTNAYAWTPRLTLCASDAGTCTDLAGTERTGTGSTTTRVLARQLYAQTGIAGNQAFTPTNLNALGMRWQNGSANAATNRVRAMAAYAQLARADAPLAVTLLDHNGDGKVCVGGIGDSTAGGTLSLTCQGGTAAGEACSQETYCDVAGVANSGITKDIPTGGCTSDAQCQTCSGGPNNRVAEFNGGAGLPCGQNNGSVSCDQCGSATNDTVTAGCCVGGNGTCGSGTGTCDGSEALSCGCDNDCLLGTCGTCSDGDCTAGAPSNVCYDACPGTGGICPTARTAWINYVPLYVGADFIGQYPGPSEPMQSMVEDRFQSIASTAQTATASLGSGVALVGTGNCQCTAGTVTADCGTGGTCTNGLCVAGDAVKIACTQNSQCNAASARQCSFALLCPNGLDYAVVHEGYNDFLQFGGGADNCTGPVSLRLMRYSGAPCDNCPVKKCISDAEAQSGRSASAECGGHILTGGLNSGTGPDYPCSVNDFADLLGVQQCLLRSNTCSTAADCEVAGQTCDGWSGGPTADGWCDCGADDASPATNCPTGYSCLNGRCRLACTTDGQCGTGGVCRTTGGANVCEGLATCPGDSADMTSHPNADACTVDADCPNFGVCTGGACACAGRPLDIAASAPCHDSALRFWNSSQALFTDSRGALGLHRFPLLTQRMQAMAGNTQLIVTSMAEVKNNDRSSNMGIRPNWMAKRWRQYLAHSLAFPHYVDLWRCYVACADPNGHTDSVHHSTSGALCLGTCVANFLNSLNVCATNAGTERAVAQKYCKTTAGAFQSTACTTVADCSAGQLCERRPCTTGSDCPSGSDLCNLETGAI